MHLSIESKAAHRDLHSFPTRRSSDLHRGARTGVRTLAGFGRGRGGRHRAHDRSGRVTASGARTGVATPVRSEEHTSELQSRVDLVCRLLLEKKNNKITPINGIEQNAT